MITKINGSTPMNNINTYSSKNQTQKSTSFKGTAMFTADVIKNSSFFDDITRLAMSTLSKINGVQSNVVVKKGVGSSWIQCKPEFDTEFKKIAEDFAKEKGYKLDFVPAEV